MLFELPCPDLLCFASQIFPSKVASALHRYAPLVTHCPALLDPLLIPTSPSICALQNKAVQLTSASTQSPRNGNTPPHSRAGLSYSSGSLWVVHLHPYFVKFPSLTHAKQPREVAVPRQERLLHTSDKASTRTDLLPTAKADYSTTTLQGCQDQERQKGKYKHDHFSDVVLFLGNSDSRPLPHTQGPCISVPVDKQHISPAKRHMLY